MFLHIMLILANKRVTFPVTTTDHRTLTQQYDKDNQKSDLLCSKVSK